MTDDELEPETRPCWELKVPVGNNGKPLPPFCASLANGHGRCPPETCFVVERAKDRPA